MGIIYTTLKIRNPLTNSETLDVEAKIDTGATLLVLPKSITDKLNFPKIRRQVVKYANETTEEKDIVAAVEVEICSRKGWFEAVVEPNKNYALIGAVVMETLDLIVEPASLQVYPNPRSNLPMAELE